jgi:Flp pilus assembly protein TadG
MTPSVALPSPQETAGKKASRRAISGNPRRPGGPGPRRARRFRLGGDRGAGSAEIVIAVPLLMLLILLVIQFAVWANAESIAHATAEEALAAARVQGGTAASGQQRAEQVISQIGSSVLAGPQVSVTMTPADVTVRVTGTAEQVLPIPGLTFAVTATVTGPVERFVPASAQG